MSLEIKKIESKKGLRAFVRFPELLYKENPYYVPYLEFDQIDTLNPKTSPAAEFCDYELYMAYRDGKPVGRVAAIVNHLNNEQWGHNQVRFGWIDFVDDAEVSKALMAKVVEFGRKHGTDQIVGPLGFTDLDPEGLLIEGYDRISTMPLIYNHPYYVKHIESMGFVKDVDWDEFVVQIPDTIPEKIDRIAAMVKERYNVHTKELTHRMVRKEDYAHKIFDMINQTYKNIYEVTELPMKFADRYIGFYLKVLDFKYITLVENEKDELVGFGITMPSLAKVLQKTRGRLFPFGWWHLMKALWFKHSDGAELMLIGVRPDYQNAGINAMMIDDIFHKFKKLGVKWAESNAELEENTRVRAQFESFNPDFCKKRRSYIAKLDEISL